MATFYGYAILSRKFQKSQNIKSLFLVNWHIIFVFPAYHAPKVDQASILASFCSLWAISSITALLRTSKLHRYEGNLVILYVFQINAPWSLSYMLPLKCVIAISSTCSRLQRVTHEHYLATNSSCNINRLIRWTEIILQLVRQNQWLSYCLPINE